MGRVKDERKKRLFKASIEKTQIEYPTGELIKPSGKRVKFSLIHYYLVFLAETGQFKYIKHPFESKDQMDQIISTYYSNFDMEFYCVRGKEIIENQILPMPQKHGKKDQYRFWADISKYFSKYQYPVECVTDVQKKNFRKQVRRKTARFHPLYKEIMNGKPGKWDPIYEEGDTGEMRRSKRRLYRERLWSRLRKEILINAR